MKCSCMRPRLSRQFCFVVLGLFFVFSLLILSSVNWVFKALIWTLAATTNVCTLICGIQAHTKSLMATPQSMLYRRRTMFGSATPSSWPWCVTTQQRSQCGVLVGGCRGKKQMKREGRRTTQQGRKQHYANAREKSTTRLEKIRRARFCVAHVEVDSSSPACCGCLHDAAMTERCHHERNIIDLETFDSCSAHVCLRVLFACKPEERRRNWGRRRHRKHLRKSPLKLRSGVLDEYLHSSSLKLSSRSLTKLLSK